MKRTPLRWCLLLALLGLAPLPAALLPVSVPPPFVQRVALADFLLLETNNDLALSPSNQLVICFPTPERPGAVDRAVALRRDVSGRRWVLSYLTAIPPREPGQFRREEKELDPVIARNVLAVFRHLLETNVYAPTGVLHPPSDQDDAWILVRDRTAAIAGVSLNLGNSPSPRGEDATVYRDLCAGLVGIFVAPPDEREDVLAQLDRFSALYVGQKRLVPR